MAALLQQHDGLGADQHGTLVLPYPGSQCLGFGLGQALALRFVVQGF